MGIEQINNIPMNENIILGLSLSLISGSFLGIFAWPMKKIINWQWENTWLMYSIWALIILPWLLAFLTVPDLFSVFGSVSFSVLFTVFLFGAGWGLANIGFGIGLKTLGLSLGTAIVLGLNNAIGAILPIVIYSPSDLNSESGRGIIIGVSIMLVGIAFSAWAGSLKEKAMRLKADTQDGSQFSEGLIICIIAGLLAAMFNFALIAGKPLETSAINSGASTLNAANPTWCISLLGGFIITLGYCMFLIRKNKSGRVFVSSGTNTNWLFSGLMGLMWFGGVALYGTAVMNLGKLGPSVGWPVIQSMAVLTGNVAGIITGEWKGTGLRPLLTMIIALLMLIAGILVISAANN